ncbi:MAG TPA: hypothetical protein VEI95_16090, partial [Acidobacteriota bacterium]|nr:hypothetical protein [Acidobacteriota bacterium]
MAEPNNADEFAAIVTSLKRHLEGRRRAGIRHVPRGNPLPAKIETVNEASLLVGTVDDMFSDYTEGMQAKTLDELRAAIGDCQRCKLCSGRTHIVFGV